MRRAPSGRSLELERFFAGRNREGRAAFMPYVTAGYPSMGAMPAVLAMLADSGADCVEIGVPFSDPVADGVTIQHASETALRKGGGMATALRAVGVAARLGLRPVLMSYANPVWQAGLGPLASRLGDEGAQGLLVPDLPPEVGREWSPAFARRGVALALFGAPTTPSARLALIGRITRGFLYYVSLAGVTGERRALARGLGARLASVRAACGVPVCAGFGVSTPPQASAVASLAEGVIVGSALVRRLEGWGRGRAERNAVGRWTRSMARAVHGAVRS